MELHNSHVTIDIDIGIRDVSPDQRRRVREGESFTFTVGFLDDRVELDEDFVLGYSLKISSNNGAGISTYECIGIHLKCVLFVQMWRQIS